MKIGQRYINEKIIKIIELINMRHKNICGASIVLLTFSFMILVVNNIRIARVHM